MNNIIECDVYEISSNNNPLIKNKVRGRLRKFAINNKINFLVENGQDKEAIVRFALISETNPQPIKDFIKSLFEDVKIELVLKKIQNPVLSKLKVNLIERYD